MGNIYSADIIACMLEFLDLKHSNRLLSSCKTLSLYIHDPQVLRAVFSHRLPASHNVGDDILIGRTWEEISVLVPQHRLVKVVDSSRVFTLSPEDVSHHSVRGKCSESVYVRSCRVEKHIPYARVEQPKWYTCCPSRDIDIIMDPLVVMGLASMEISSRGTPDRTWGVLIHSVQWGGTGRELLVVTPNMHITRVVMPSRVLGISPGPTVLTEDGHIFRIPEYCHGRIRARHGSTGNTLRVHEYIFPTTPLYRSPPIHAASGTFSMMTFSADAWANIFKVVPALLVVSRDGTVSLYRSSADVDARTLPMERGDSDCKTYYFASSDDDIPEEGARFGDATMLQVSGNIVRITPDGTLEVTAECMGKPRTVTYPVLGPFRACCHSMVTSLFLW